MSCAAEAPAREMRADRQLRIWHPTCSQPSMRNVLADTERRRIQTHLLGAEHEARGRERRDLDVARQATRTLLLEELALYRRAGVFPHNPDFDVPMPYFIDASGTRCAMAHLMEIGGASDLVAEVATTRNNAFVAELADDPRVLAWLEAAGLLPEEAARIQPSYCPSTAAGCVCGTTARTTTAIARGRSVASDAGAGNQFLVEEMAGFGTGACASTLVGDEVRLLGTSYTSETITVGLAEWTEGPGVVRCAAYEVYATSAGVTKCNNGLADSRIPADLPPAEVLSALKSSDCEGYLAQKDQAWTAPPANVCEKESSPGCNAAGAPFDLSAAVSTTMILAAILAYRARRQRFR